MNNRTKSPWRMGPAGCIVSSAPVVGGINGTDNVEFYDGYLIAESVTDDNAAFIVDACNNHERLLLALKAAQVYVNMHGSDDEIIFVGEAIEAAEAE